MSRVRRHRLSLAVAIITLGLLGWLTIQAPAASVQWRQWFLFTVLISFTIVFGVPLGGGEVSLLPMAVVAACLVMGAVPAAWAAFVSAIVRGIVRQRWASQLRAQREPNLLTLLAVSAANATMHSLSVLVSGEVYARAGGATPLAMGDVQAVPLILLCVAYLASNYFLAGLYLGGLGRASVKLYLSSLPNLMAYEATPLVFSPLMALTCTGLGLGPFLLFSLALVAVSLIARNLAHSRLRLERRVKELDSLRAVGRALSASLELTTILQAVYDQVSQLMPAHNFYIALCDEDIDEVSFPLAVEGGQQVQAPSRRPGNGLTEYIMRTQSPVLIERDVGQRLEELGLEQLGPLAECWLGVPILAGSSSLGVIAVQSYESPAVYDANHEQVLVTIAGQASTAIQNARLYARTDATLARRVQELDSILRTAPEGMLLLDARWRVVAANRGLARSIGVAQTEMIGQVLGVPQDAETLPLIERMGYTVQELQAECASLARDGGECSQTVVQPGLPERHLRRTLAPVHGHEGAITGWLLVFRDVSEEIALNRFRDDMTHMLVHDLRSPLAVLRGSLDMIEHDAAHDHVDRVGHWVDSARSSSDRMLNLIDQLLDISKLENGQLSTDLRAVDIGALFEDTAQRLSTLAREARIKLQIVTEPGLPSLYVDQGLIGRALNNLVDNAIKFTPNGGLVRLWARLNPDSDPTTLWVGVSDTGSGIPPDAQVHLFQKFRQKVSTTGRRRGTGLGLPFCRLAVQAHGGEIWVESPSAEIENAEDGEGSTFVMRLPTVNAAKERLPASEEIGG
jgi:two-component system, NtrC family, sensor histidine kinase KinB